MKYIVAFITAAVCAVLSYTTLDKKITDKIKLLNFTNAEEKFSSKEFTQFQRIIITVFVFTVSFASGCCIMQYFTDILNMSKMFVSLFCLTGAACVDFREHRIPNIFPLFMAGLGIVFLTLGFILSQDGAVSYVISSIFATVCTALCLLIASLLTKHGIGAGDIKLLCALSIIGGANVVGGTVFFGMIICALTAAVLLISKKKNMKESLPFGPFIYLGFIISVLTTIY